MNLARLLENTAKRLPGHVGLRFEGKNYTYEELDRRVNSLANGLISLGLEPGDKCILMMQSSPEFITAYYALAKIGAVIIPSSAIDAPVTSVPSKRIVTPSRVGVLSQPKTIAA